MQLASGRAFWPLDPWPEEIHIEDIAHALSNICRFGGHTRAHYSIAQHSVLVSRICYPRDALRGLLHDASEAYVGDVIRPIKRLREMVEYRVIEQRIQGAIAERFNLLSAIEPASVKLADERALATECRDLMGGQRGCDWQMTATPLDEIIVPMDPMSAKRAFYERYLELTEGKS